MNSKYTSTHNYEGSIELDEFREMVDEFSTSQLDREFLQYIRECMNNIDFVEGVDYGQVLKVKNNVRNSNKLKNGVINGNNWFGRN